jgi:type I phosphodiesterase/nucleotide pyrophosphatase
MTPRYGTGSLADLLPSVFAVVDPLTGVADALGEAERFGVADRLGLRPLLPGVRRICLLLVDGLGHHLLPDAVPVAPTLAAADEALVLTSCFPSTTPTSLVSLGTGAAPGIHGVVGFTVAIPGTDRALSHVDWDPAVDPVAWQPVPPRFRAGTTVVAPPAFANSGLTVAAYRGAAYRGATGVADTVTAATDALRTDRLCYVYRPDVDRAAHLSGPGSPDWLDAVAETDALVAGLAAALPPDAALLVTADHGAVPVPEADKIDIDAVPELTRGVTAIAGEPRARYVHAPDPAPVLDAWRDILGDRARVLTRAEAIATGWYGPVTPAAAERIGDIVAVCTGTHALVRRTAAPSEAALRGYHGALTDAEMAIPLLVIPGG